MRLKARTNFTYDGIAYKREDVFDVDDAVGLHVINRDLAMPWNLEDPTQRSESVELLPAEPLPDVPPVTISPTEAAVPAAGGAGSFDVTITGAGTSGTWTVDKDAAATWLTLVSPTTPQTTGGTVNYDVDPNDAAERVAHFYTNGKTFTVTQDGAAARGATAHRRR